MSNKIIDTSAVPVYQHFIYDHEGRYLFLKYSFSDEPDSRYLELLQKVDQHRKSRSALIRAVSLEERKRLLHEPVPGFYSWENGIQTILPQNLWKTDGSRRVKLMKARVERNIKKQTKKIPLFTETMIQDEIAKELEEKADYFRGESVYDEQKNYYRKLHTDEYWQVYRLADCGWCTSVI